MFAINDAVSTLGGDLTPFFVDRGARITGALRAADAGNGGDGAGAASAAQAERKAKLDADRVDTVAKWATGCCCGPRSCSTPPT